MPATTEKPPNLAKELAALERMTATELREKYAAVFGEPAASGNRAWLARRVGWRMQALAEGDLSDRAKARAAELARDADLLHDTSWYARRTTLPTLDAQGSCGRLRHHGRTGIDAIDPWKAPPAGAESRKSRARSGHRSGSSGGVTAGRGRG